jgi:transposase
MKRRKWTNEEKFKIVLEGLQSCISIAELCNKHEIQQSQYYSWRDKFLREGSNIFQNNDVSKREEQLKNKMAKIEQMIGKMTLELKKTTNKNAKTL